jgi:hypothetical protein
MNASFAVLATHGPLEPAPQWTPAERYTRLINRLSTDEPHTGWESTRQLGQISTADLVTVLTRESIVAADACCDERVMRDLIYALNAESTSEQLSNEILGAAFRRALKQQAAVYLLDKLQDESARDAERALFVG